MKYGELMASLRQGKLDHLYLLAGEEGYFIDKAEAKLLDVLGCQRDDVQVLDESSPVMEIVGAIEAVPFFTDKNVVIVRAGGLFKDRKPEAEGKKKSPEDVLYKLLANVPEFSYVIFTLHGKVDKRKKLYKLLQSSGTVLEAEPLRANHIGDWLQGKLQEIHKEMDRAAYEYFVAAAGSMSTVNLNFLNKELDKLALFLGPEQRRITREHLLQAFSNVPEISGFAMLNAIGEQKTARALKLFRQQLENGVYFALIVGMLARQVRLWWLAQELQAKKVYGRNLATALGQPPFIAEKTGREARTFPPRLLQDVLLALSDADYALKTGQGDLVELEAAIIALGNRAELT